jgi:putative transposase
MCRELRAEIVAFDGERDHVHLLLRYPPSVSISDLAGRLKGASSRLLRQSRPDIARRFRKDVLWSPSYFATSCGGAPIAVIRQYIEQQQTPEYKDDHDRQRAAHDRPAIHPRGQPRGFSRKLGKGVLQHVTGAQ